MWHLTAELALFYDFSFRMVFDTPQDAAGLGRRRLNDLSFHSSFLEN